MKTDLRKTSKNDFEKDFFKLMNKAILEKRWKTLEKIEILNLPRQKEEETIWFKTRLLYHKVFHRKYISERNEKHIT